MKNHSALSKALNYVLEKLLFISYAIEKQRETHYYDDFKVVRLAVGCADDVSYLQLLPIPRTLLLFIALFLIAKKKGEYKTWADDEYGFGSATFSEINRAISREILSCIIIDALVFGSLCAAGIFLIKEIF